MSKFTKLQCLWTLYSCESLSVSFSRLANFRMAITTSGWYQRPNDCKLRKEKQSLAIVKRDDSYLFVPRENRMVEKIGNVIYIKFEHASRTAWAPSTMMSLQRQKQPDKKQSQISARKSLTGSFFIQSIMTSRPSTTLIRCRGAEKRLCLQHNNW